MNKLAIGTAQFGMDYGISNCTGKLNSFCITKLLNLAKENGIDTLDTAKHYGNSEYAIGRYLKQCRDKSWHIITKIQVGYKNILDEILDSKKKLTVEPFAILTHSPKLFLDKKFQEDLNTVKEQSIVKKVGVSIYSEEEIVKILESQLIPDIIQLPLNILDTRLYEHGLIQELANLGIELHARSIFLQGLFYLNEDKIKGYLPEALHYIDKLKIVASKYRLSVSELSLLWVLNLREISKVVIGIENSHQLKIHLETAKKNLETDIVDEALSIKCKNEKILNPTLWP